MSLLEKEQEERLVHEGIPEGDGYTALDSGMKEEVEKYILTPTLVKREDLVPNQANDKFGIYDIEELAESIRVFSLLQPLHVKKRSDGKYDIISGHRRFLAICMLQDQKQNCYMDGIPCVYSNVPTSKLDEMILVYEANIHSRKYGGEYLGYIRDLYNLYLEKQNEDENFRIESGNLANYLGMKLGFKNSRQSKKYINIFDRAEGWIYDAIEDKKRYRRYDASNSDADRENCRIAKNGELKKGMTIDDAVIITNLDNVDDQEKLHRLYDENGFITDEVLDRYRKKKGKQCRIRRQKPGRGWKNPKQVERAMLDPFHGQARHQQAWTSPLTGMMTIWTPHPGIWNWSASMPARLRKIIMGIYLKMIMRVMARKPTAILIARKVTISRMTGQAPDMKALPYRKTRGSEASEAFPKATRI